MVDTIHMHGSYPFLWLRGGGNGDEHSGYLISSIRRFLKYKIYSPRSISFLGFVASYIKKVIKIGQSQVGSALLIVWALLNTSLCSRLPCCCLPSSQHPRSHLHTASTPRSHLHIHWLYACPPSHAQLGFLGLSICWPFTWRVRGAFGWGLSLLLHIVVIAAVVVAAVTRQNPLHGGRTLGSVVVMMCPSSSWHGPSSSSSSGPPSLSISAFSTSISPLCHFPLFPLLHIISLHLLTIVISSPRHRRISFHCHRFGALFGPGGKA